MYQDYIISITKNRVCINGLECTENNYEEVFNKLGIGPSEAMQIIKTLSMFIKSKKLRRSYDF